MNSEAIKAIKTEFDTELKSDKLYAPIARAIKKLIGDIPSELKEIAQNDTGQKTLFSNRLEAINHHYQQHEDFYLKAINILATKNEAEIKKIRKNRNSKFDKITKRFNLQLDDINKRREQIESEYSHALSDIETTYQRDIGSYQKVTQSARKLNQKVTQDIESEQQVALESLKSTHQTSARDRKSQKELLIKAFEEKKKDIDERQALTTTTNNDVYLSIKTDYNQFSVIFNKKINELNKENQKALKTIKDRYEDKRRPIDALLVKLKEDYKTAVERIKSSYQAELTAMNTDFDLKKHQYEDKKERIIHESNEIISLLNSKLTAYKESVNRENLETARDIRNKMKSTDVEFEQNNLQKELRANLKNANNEINKQILRTNREIANRQREFHFRLYNHDLTYIKTLNDWRLAKNLAAYNHKQSLAKIELNFNHNIAQSKAQLALNETIYKHQEQHLNLSLNRDLLALETQLQIASLVQERELNLLTNDQQIAINLAKLEHAKLEFDQQLALEDLDFAQKQDDLSYEYNQLTVNSNTQLELEKARSARDFSLQEQQIRSDIAKKIYERNEHMLNLEKQARTLAIDHELKMLEMTQDDDAFHIDINHRGLTHKRVSFIMKATIKNQKRMSLLAVKKQADMDWNLLLDNQYHVIQFTNYLLSLYNTRYHMRTLIHDLYLLPSHPETFKKALLLAMRFDHEMDVSMKSYISDYEIRMRELLKAKITDQANYRYVMKYDQVMKFYHAKQKRIDREQKTIESEIQLIEQNYIKYQGDIDQNKAFIEQLIKINDQIKSGLLPLQTSYDYKENTKLIKNHQNIISHLKDNMKRADKIVDVKHREINTLARAQTAVQKSMETATKRLIREKSTESQFYLKHLVKHDKHFKVMNKRLSIFTHHSMAFYGDLKELVYVTNDALKDAFKKLKTHKQAFEKSLVQIEQRLLKDTLSFYQECQEINQAFNTSFEQRTKRYLSQIDQTIHTFMRDQENAIKMQETSLLKQIHAANRDESHQKDILNLNKDKATHEDLHEIKELENKLDAHLVHSESEINALNENQKAIALQYVKEVEQHMDGHEKEHQKHIAFFKTRYNNTFSDFDGSNQTLLNKNQVLLIRYATQRTKSLENMKNKSIHYASQIEHHLADIQKAMDLHQKDASSRDKRRQDELKNIQNHVKRFEAQAETSQKNALGKDIVALKRNLNFKLKALKLS